MSPILKNSVHEMSPFESVHEKSPILKNSVHEMSLSTKCLHSVPVLFGGHNLPPLVEIRLTSLPNSGGAMEPPAPPGTTPLYWTHKRTRHYSFSSKVSRLYNISLPELFLKNILKQKLKKAHLSTGQT